MKEFRPLISVIVNCYNSRRYLAEAVTSIINQTYDNWELIFWDNCSTDNSVEIVKALDTQGKVRYFREEKNIPLGFARNKAIREARGEYFAFLDCDDVYMPDMLQKHVDVLQHDDYALSYAGINNINEAGEKLSEYIPAYSSGVIFGKLLQQFDIYVPTMLINKKMLWESGLNFDPNIHGSEEYCLLMQYLIDRKVAVIHEVLANYRIHEESLTNRSIHLWAAEREYTLDLIKKNHPGIEKKYASQFREAYARANYYRARSFLVQNEKGSALKELGKAFFVHYRYAMLFILLLFPTPVWHFVHVKLKKRKNFS